MDGMFDFYVRNLKRTNKIFNKLLLLYVFVAPIIAIGIACGLYISDISYTKCIVIFVSALILYASNKFLIEKYPYSTFTAFWALLGLELMILETSMLHLGINLIYFIMPLMSLLYCKRRMYVDASIFAFLGMVISVYIDAAYSIEHYVGLTVNQVFVGIISGYCIEYFFMFLAGLAVNSITINHVQEVDETLNSIKDKYLIFSSMSEIYISMHQIDLDNDTIEEILSNDDIRNFSSAGRNANNMIFHAMGGLTMDEYKDVMYEFVDLTTLDQRLEGKKIVTREFMGNVHGWCRASFIVVARNDYGRISKVLYTVEEINDEKQKEENLIEISITDPLTGLSNRRGLRLYFKEKYNNVMKDDIVIITFDVNGLKIMNDNFGHLAGDKLLIGTAKCLEQVFGATGKCFRVGGDEFVVLTEGDNEMVADKLDALVSLCAEYQDGEIDGITLSAGYVIAGEHEDKSFESLTRIADDMMYEAKRIYYENKESV